MTDTTRRAEIGHSRTRALLRAVLVCALVTGLGLGTSACKQRPDFSQPSSSAPAEGTAVGAATPTMIGMEPAGLISAVDDFGLNLLRQSNRAQAPNTIVSPLAVHAVLSMTANGAVGDTRVQMLDTLGIGHISDGGNAQWAGLLREIASRNPSQTVEIANALWAGKGMPFKPVFMAADQGFYGAELSNVNFGEDNAVRDDQRLVRWQDGRPNHAHARLGEPEHGADADQRCVLQGRVGATLRADADAPPPVRRSRRQDRAPADDVRDAPAPLRHRRGVLGDEARVRWRPEFALHPAAEQRHIGRVTTQLPRRDEAGEGSAQLETAKPTAVEVGLPKLDTGYSVALDPALKALGTQRA